MNNKDNQVPRAQHQLFVGVIVILLWCGLVNVASAEINNLISVSASGGKSSASVTSVINGKTVIDEHVSDSESASIKAETNVTSNGETETEIKITQGTTSRNNNSASAQTIARLKALLALLQTYVSLLTQSNQ